MAPNIYAIFRTLRLCQMRLYLDFTSYPEMKMAHGKYKYTGKAVIKKVQGI